MSKLNLILVSLVAAIPAGILSTVLALNFLNSADKMEGMLQLISAVTLGLSVLVTVLPLGILIFGAKDEKPVTETKASKKDAGEPVSQAEVSVVEEGAMSSVVIPTRDTGDFEITDPEMAAFESGDDDFVGAHEMESADFGEEFADFGDEEEEAPKKKKKGKR